jgi:hypothetical protein
MKTSRRYNRLIAFKDVEIGGIFLYAGHEYCRVSPRKGAALYNGNQLGSKYWFGVNTTVEYTDEIHFPTIVRVRAKAVK